MSNYTSFYIDYLEKNLFPVPCHGKAAVLKEWTDINSYIEENLENINANNIGLLLGKVSNLLVLDIDVEDKAFQDLVYSIVPTSPVGKIGNKKRGRNLFYQYSELDLTEFRKQRYVEILSDGKQTVIPPSKHPDGYQYEWAGETILDVDVKDLPKLNQNHVNELIVLTKGYFGKELSGQHINTGRNNKLKQMVAAKINENTPFDTIVDEIFSYDKYIHTPPLFSDKNEKTNFGNEYANCYAFCSRIFSSLKDKKYTGALSYKKIKLSDVDVEEFTYKDKKLPHLRGIGEKMFKYIYETSPIPRSQFAFASVISTISTIIGNKMHYNGVYSNLYSLILSPSGFGKDKPIKFPYKLFQASGCMDLIGEAHPASDTGIMMGLSEKQIRLDAIDEAATLFGSINNKGLPYLAKMGDVYAQLYTSSGDYFAGKNTYKAKGKDNDTGNIGACFSPCVSMLAAMTIEDFKSHFSLSTIDKGLGGRFLYFIDNEFKRSDDPEFKEIPEDIINFTKRLRKPIGLNDKPVNVRITPRAKVELRTIHSGIEQIKEKQIKTDSKLMPIYNRLYPNLIKLILVDVASTQGGGGLEPLNYTQMKIDIDNVRWAHDVIKTFVGNMAGFLDENLSGNFSGNKIIFIESAIRGAGSKGLEQQILSRKCRQRFGILSKELSGLVGQLELEGSIFKDKKTFYHSNFCLNI